MPRLFAGLGERTLAGSGCCIQRATRQSGPGRRSKRSVIFNSELATDAYAAYDQVVRDVFGVGAKHVLAVGKPGAQQGSTSYVERNNLTIRMGNGRYTRRTNAHSKRIEKHCQMLALCLLHYNFCRVRSGIRCSPTMEAGLTKTLHDMEWIVRLIGDMERARPWTALSIIISVS